MDSYWPLIVTVLVAALPGVIALLGNRQSSTADVAGKYRDIASRQAADNLKLEECQERLEQRVAGLEQALVNKDNKIVQLEIQTSNQEKRITGMVLEAEQSEQYICELIEYVEELMKIMQAANLKVPARPRRKSQ